MKTTASHLAAANEQLEAGYQLLWSFNEYEDFDEIRTNLFSLILCSFTSLSLPTVTETLRIRLGEDRSYDEALACEQVAPLYANFLTVNSRGLLGFVHDTARYFVINMRTKAKRAVDLKESTILEEIERDNHIYVTDLYIQVMKLPVHDVWARSGYGLQRWREFNSSQGAPVEGDPPIYLKDLTLKWKHQEELDNPPKLFAQEAEPRDMSMLLYLASFGLRHCRAASRKASIFDERWAEILDKLVLSSSPAFAFTLEATSWLSFKYLHGRPNWRWDPYMSQQIRNGASHMLEVRDGQFELRHSHVLAALNIISQDDFSQLQPQLGHLTSNRAIPESRDQRLLLLLQHANIVDPSGGSVIDFAIDQGNSAAVAFFLYGTYHLHGRQAALDLLGMKFSGPNTYFEAPFSAAIKCGDASMLGTMLDIEIQCHQTAEENHPTAPRSDNRIAQQWSQPFGLGVKSRERVLHQVVRRCFDENTICRLFGIGRPPNVNLHDNFERRTALHYAAARGFLQLTNDLVERYGADIHSKDYRGYRPSFYAFYYRRDDVLNYLLEKEGQSTYPEDARCAEIGDLLRDP